MIYVIDLVVIGFVPFISIHRADTCLHFPCSIWGVSN